MAGEEKAAWCANFAAERGIELGACWGYADSYYDLPFLTALGHPVAVNPDRRLRAAAHNRQWPIIRFTKTAANRDRGKPADGDASTRLGTGTPASPGTSGATDGAS